MALAPGVTTVEGTHVPMWELHLVTHYLGSSALDLGTPANQELKIHKMGEQLKTEVLYGGFVEEMGLPLKSLYNFSDSHRQFGNQIITQTGY